MKEKVEEVNRKKMREKKAESLCMDEVMGKEEEEEEERSDWRRVEGMCMYVCLYVCVV